MCFDLSKKMYAMRWSAEYSTRHNHRGFIFFVIKKKYCIYWCEKNVKMLRNEISLHECCYHYVFTEVVLIAESSY